MAGDVGTTERKTQVFISYSRRDAEAADRLHSALEAAGFDSYLDRHDIAAGEDWRARLGGLIESADTMVFLVSPDSIASEICDWEINHAELKGKRILPVVTRDAGNVPERLKRLNYVFMRSPEEETASLPRLAEALAVDIGWIRAHTRYGEDAGEWDEAGRPSRLLLRGASISEAERWRDARPATAPQLTETQSALIAASRRGATNRQRGWIAGSLVVAVIASGLSVYALIQQQAAEASRAEAVSSLAAADLRQGSQLIDSDSAPDNGIAYLARAARLGNRLAMVRLWTVLQQKNFWLPTGDRVAVEAPVGEAPDASLLGDFETVDVNGVPTSATQIRQSDDGSRIVVTVGGTSTPAFRVWTKGRVPITDWMTPPYVGSTEVSAISAFLSPQGRYLVVEVRGLRETSYLVLYDLDAPGGPRELSVDEITAIGPRGEIENAHFSTLRMKHREGEDDSVGFPLLVTGSTRGTAQVVTYFSEEDGADEPGVYFHAESDHRAAIKVANIDEGANLLLTVDVERNADVFDILYSQRLGNKFRLDDIPADLSVLPNGVLRATFSDDTAQDYIFTNTLGRPVPAGTVAKPPLPCLHSGEPPLDHPSGLTLAIAGERSVTLARAGTIVATSPQLDASILTVCATADGTIVSISTADLGTEIWRADLTTRLGPPLDETRFFASKQVPDLDGPDMIDFVAIDQETGVALVQASARYTADVTRRWATLWDIETGLPISEPADGGNIAISAISLAPDIGRLLMTGPDGTILRTVEYRVPAAIEAQLPDILELLGGRTVGGDGAPVPATDRGIRLAKVNEALTPYWQAP